MRGSWVYNYYCDESCHLQKDGKRFMVLGYIAAPLHKIEQMKGELKSLRVKYKNTLEVKCTYLNEWNYPFYAKLVDWFFKKGGIRFRAIIVDKSRYIADKCDHDYNKFYYLMYYQLLFHTLDPVWHYNIYLDIKDNSADWNPQFELIEGIIAEPFVQKYIDFFDIQTMAARLHNKESMSSEFKLKEGSWFLSMVVPQNYDKNGNVTSVLIANRDVTDEKMRELRQEEELREAKLKAECANKAKSSFLFNMSHDIRTPMNAILGYAQLMENELNGKDIPEVLEHLEKLQQSGNLLLSIINNVLDMARIESGRMEIDENYCRIEDVWKSLFAVFDEKARKKNISLHYTMNVEHEHVLTDVTKVKEILVNILSNAIKYTPAGGSVMVYVDELPCDESGYMIVRIRISDTGIGMSQDYLTKIFEAFTREKNTTKSKIAGTGLGMSIVKNYVDLLGGTIDVESELGKGSTFTVTLKHRIADERYYVKKHIEEPGTGNEILEGRNILLAEDNDLNAEIAEAILERAGLRIERVENGIQCVNRILKMPAGTYDMIFMDIQMPQMDGYKATQTIRNLPDKDKACIPIIAMTANAFAEDKKKTMEAGMNAHLSKPLNVPELMDTIRKFCDGKQMCQRPGKE